MKRFEKIALAKNIGASWLGLAVNVCTGIVISPYILHRLGDEAFGLWVLVFSITGYYGLFDFGIRSSVVRYVARFSATGDYEQLNRVVNTSLFSYSFVFLLVSAITIIASFFIDKVISIHPGYAHTARILFRLVGLSLAIGFPLGVFAGILEGLQRFYLINCISITTTLVRAFLIVIALNRGCGLLTVAWITVLLPIVNQSVNAVNAFRLARIQLRRRFLSVATFKQLLNYGSISFVATVAENLRFRTDEVVIGSVLSAAAITPFAIGARIVDYATDVVASLAQVFTPMSTHFDARGELDKLRSLLVAGNRGCALVIFPICASLVILGKSVIRVWMGQKYVAASYPVLLCLLIACLLRMSQATSGRILFGMARHKALAGVILAEGVANLLLSIFLTARYGILGCALGTAIPMTFTYLIFLPTHACRILGARLGEFLVQAYTMPFVLCVPLVVVLLAMQRWFIPGNLLQLIAQIAVGAMTYAIVVYYFMFVKGPLRISHGRVDGFAVAQAEDPVTVAPISQGAGFPIND